MSSARPAVVSRRPAPPPAIVFATAGARALPASVDAWLAGLRTERMVTSRADELMAVALRTRPRVVVLDARGSAFDAALAVCGRLKRDSYTGIVPTVVVTDPGVSGVMQALGAGADEAIADDTPDQLLTVRLESLLLRSDRDTGVHPSTRLPGAIEIERDIARRLHAGVPFAVCYADLDHFKEFNDRYGYNNGDRIIRILARILHDVVKGVCGEDGFVGHIGGDDFLCVLPLAPMEEACAEIIAVFDALIPFQYSEPDRRSGYFFGKDRRGRLHRVPLMTLSIGVVTNARRVFTQASQVSELATEMKSYAKSLPGSIYSIDRRLDAESAASMAAEDAEQAASGAGAAKGVGLGAPVHGSASGGQHEVTSTREGAGTHEPEPSAEITITDERVVAAAGQASVPSGEDR